MRPRTYRRPVAWVLERSRSIWVGVIQRRSQAGDAPEALATVFDIRGDWFGVVRWPVESSHQELVLALERGPRGAPS